MAEEVSVSTGVYALAAAPGSAQGSICLAAGPFGLRRSTDGGATWHDAYASLGASAPLPTTAVALSPAFARDGHVFAGAGGAVLRSTDCGQTWTAAALPLPPPVVTALAVAPGYDGGGTVLAGTLEDGVLRSPDGGATWETWNFGLLDPRVLCLAVSADFAHDETVLAGTESGIFASSNGGRSWRPLGFPADRAPVLSLALSPRYGEDGTILAGSEAGGLWRSADGGLTWTSVREDALSGAVATVLVDADFPRVPYLAVLLDGALWWSRDGGLTWARGLGAGADEEITAVAAPVGLAPGAPLWLGLGDGRAVRATLA